MFGLMIILFTQTVLQINFGVVMAIIKINGFKCRYEVTGDKKARETIVFINGIANPLESWGLVKKQLEFDYRVVTYDLRGQWFSEVTEGQDYSFRTMAEDLNHLVEALNIPNFHVVGTSLGGEIAMWFQLLYPYKIKSLSVVASAPEVSELMLRQIWRWKNKAVDAVIEITNSQEPFATTKLMGHKFYQEMMPDVFCNKFIEENQELIAESEALVGDLCTLDFFKGHIKLCDMFARLKSDERLTHHLSKINCPAIFVAAENDLVKPPKYSEHMHQKVPGSEYAVIKDAAHAVFFEKPDELSFVLMQFITKHADGVTKMYPEMYGYSEGITIN